MKKLVVLIIATFTAISAYADYFPAVIYLLDSTQIECLMNHPKIDAKTITYKISKKSKAEKVESKLIEKIRILFEDSGDYTELQYLSCYNMGLYWKTSKKAGKPTWLTVLIEGPVTLYLAESFMRGGGPLRTDVSFTYYICKRKNENVATIITMPKTVGGSPLAHVGPIYFADYPELAERLKNKEFKDSQIEKVVNEYNLWKITENNE
jgi:hypothetical protein